MTTSWREDAITVLFGAWLMIGLAVDGWAHNNLAQLETFFTPWHALFYSGFAATAAWIVSRAMRRRGPSGEWVDVIPAGYGLGVAGLVLFGLGGVGDMIWHTIFGIEANIDALMSPTHLLLYLGGVLILTSPLRAAWRRPGAVGSFVAFAPALLSTALGTGLTAFMFLYLSPFLDVDMSARPGDDYLGFLSLRSGIAGILLTTVILFSGALVLLRRWRTPMPSFTVMFALVAALIQAVGAFERPWLIAVGALGGLAADLLVRSVRPAIGSPWRFRLFALAAPMAFWAIYTAAASLREGIGWEVEIWTGAVIWSGLTGLGLSFLMLPMAAPDERVIDEREVKREKVEA